MTISKVQTYLLYLFAFSMVFENWPMMDFHGTSIPKLIGFVFIAISLLDIKSILSWVPIKQYLYPLLFFLIVLVLSFILNYNYDVSSLWLIRGILLNILFFVFISAIIINKPEVGFNMFFFLNLGILVLTLLYLFNIGVSYEEEGGRLSIFGLDSNSIGMFSVISILYILSLIFENILNLSKSRYWLGLVLLPLLSIVAGSASRTTFIGLMLSLLVFFILQKKGNLGTRMLIIIIGLFFIFLAFNFLMESGLLRERMLNAIEMRDLSGRDRIWQYVIPSILNKPVFGIGVNGYTKLISYTHGRFFSPHNVFIELLAYAGTAGLLCFLLFYFRMVKTAWQNLQKSYYVLPLVLLMFIFLLFFAGQGLVTKPFWVIYAYIVSTPFYFRHKILKKEDTANDTLAEIINSSII